MGEDKIQQCYKQALIRSREVYDLIETACTPIDR